jgi:hypothetical protein
LKETDPLPCAAAVRNVTTIKKWKMRNQTSSIILGIKQLKNLNREGGYWWEEMRI